MELVKLGKNGQITLPCAMLRSVGLTDETPLLVETTSDGAIVLRSAEACPVEMYSDGRIAEFERRKRRACRCASQGRRGHQVANVIGGYGWTRTTDLSIMRGVFYTF